MDVEGFLNGDIEIPAGKPAGPGEDMLMPGGNDGTGDIEIP